MLILRRVDLISRRANERSSLISKPVNRPPKHGKRKIKFACQSADIFQDSGGYHPRGSSTRRRAPFMTVELSDSTVAPPPNLKQKMQANLTAKASASRTVPGNAHNGSHRGSITTNFNCDI